MYFFLHFLSSQCVLSSRRKHSSYISSHCSSWISVGMWRCITRVLQYLPQGAHFFMLRKWSHPYKNLDLQTWKPTKKYTINTGQMGKNWMTLFTQDSMAGLFDFTSCIYLNEGELAVNLSEMLIFWTNFFSEQLDNKGCGPKRECQKYLSIFSVIWWRRWPWAPRRRGVRKTCTHGTGSWCWWWNKNPYNISVCHYCRLSTATGTTERKLTAKRKE